MTLKLIIGNKNYSSWSMRPWIAMKAAGIPFDETVISLYVEGSEAQIREHSPAGKVPILIDGDVRVWESLAIIEYLAEKFPDRAALAVRPGGARACARDLDRDACRLRAAAPAMRHEHVAPARQARPVG